MTYVHQGRLGARPGERDALLRILIAPNEELAAAGCLAYEVGADPDDPDAVLVTELWRSAEAHRGSLGLPSVRAAIAQARPLLSGRMDGTSFQSDGSPLRAAS